MGGYRDLREHLRVLEERNLLVRVTRPINKDTELHPLVRWQYRGGLPEEAWRGFLFEHVIDSRGRRYGVPVAVGVMAGSRAIYGVGMGCTPEEIPDRWERALRRPIAPVLVDDGPVHEEVHVGPGLLEHGGLDEFPVPISTPGFDNAPYTTCSHWVTKDPDTGIRNVGNYRGQLKSPTRTGLYVLDYHDFWHHWHKAKARGIALQAAVVVGAPPCVAFASVQPVPYGVDEYGIAGGLVDHPVELVRCKTVDLEVPATAEIVLEGEIPTDSLEPEGPFGESYGYVQLKNLQPYFNVTCITHRLQPIWASFISQVTPSESSKIKEVGYEPLLTKHLRDDCSIGSVLRVAMHEPLSNLRPYVVIQFRRPDQADVWRAMYALLGRYGDIGKVVVAVDEDIDPKDPESVNWAISYRMQPDTDVQILPGRKNSSKWQLLIPEDKRGQPTLWSLLLNATLKTALPPISLPKEEFMLQAKAIWEELGLPRLTPRVPWYGYSLGHWPAELEEEAQLAVRGEYYRTGEMVAQQRQRP